MLRRPTWLHRAVAGEEGIAMVTAILMISIMSILAAIMMANISSELSGVGRQRQVTTSRDAADAGIDQLVFQLQQTPPGSSQQNWTTLQQAYHTDQSNPNANWWPAGGWSNPAPHLSLRPHPVPEG